MPPERCRHRTHAALGRIIGADGNRGGRDSVQVPGQLRWPRFRRLFPDIYVFAVGEPHLGLRSRAAALFVDGRGVLDGYSAAELLGASCGPADAPAEVVLLDGHRQRPLRGLLVRRDRRRHRCPRCSGRHTRRTANDLARRLPLTEAVVAVDALAFAHGFDPADLLVIGRAHLGARRTPRRSPRRCAPTSRPRPAGAASARRLW